MGSDSCESLRTFVDTELALAARKLQARGGRVHAGVHQARKSIRRARAALMLAGPRLGAGATLVGRELRAANRSLSGLRDAQALVAMLDTLARKTRDPEEQRLVRRARRIAAAARAAAGRDPGHRSAVADARDALAVLRAALAGLPWEQVAAADLQAGLVRTRERVATLRDRAVRSGEDQDWHRWRRWIRRQSQQQRACAAIGVESPEAPFDKSLAEQLGVMQNLSLLIAHCRRGSPFAKPDRAALRRIARRKLRRQRERIASVTAPEATPLEAAET